MFCELVGSSALAARLDPEELGELVSTLHEIVAREVALLDGHIAQVLAEGALVYFGYPSAQEDGPLRSVEAGLAILRSVAEANVARSEPICVRLGIHTGAVVIGEMGAEAHPEHLALGGTPNIAARILQASGPDQILISEETYRLVRGRYQCTDLGRRQLRGLSETRRLYAVVRRTTARSRFDVAVRTGLTPLVGRDRELALLRERWEWCQQGRGQVVLLSGEAGIGKSRLAREMRHLAARGGGVQMEFRCASHHRGSALHPVTDLLRRILRVTDGSPEQSLERLEEALTEYRFPGSDTLPLLAALLSLPHPAGHPRLSMSPEGQKKRTHEALVAWILEQAETRDVCCVWEDLHWADPSSLDLLTELIDQIPTFHILLVLSFRPSFRPPWPPRSFMSQITLSGLEDRHVDQMVGEVVRRKRLPVEVLEEIVAKTDGVPLFVEELTKTVLESGLLVEDEDSFRLSGPLPTLAIPATLQDSLMARLDRLSAVRDIAQLAATLGREFSYELMREVCALEEETLRAGLDRLVRAELVHQRGIPPRATYVFKHSLVQETAYRSLLKSSRMQYHRRIAEVLQGRLELTPGVDPQILAYHYTEAGLARQALPFWKQAGLAAIRRSANREAISHLRKAIDLLPRLAGDPDLAQQELELQILLGPALMAAKGYAAREVEESYARARELNDQLGPSPQQFTVVEGLWGFHIVRGRLNEALQLAGQLLRLAEGANSAGLLLEAHYALGAAHFYRGELPDAQRHSVEGMSHYDRDQRRYHRSLQDTGVACLSYDAWALWHLGYPDQALKRSEAALALAKELNHPISLAWAHVFAAMLGQCRKDAEAAEKSSAIAAEICTEQDFAFWLALARMVHGWALVMVGRVDEGLDEARDGLGALRPTGAELGRAYFLGRLAEVFAVAQQPNEGLGSIEEALTVVRNGERFHEAELYRVAGELELVRAEREGGWTQAARTAAESRFHRALEVARAQGARSLELRSALALCRLLAGSKGGEGAVERLANIYGRFTEGFADRDLIAARELLAGLAPPPGRDSPAGSGG